MEYRARMHEPGVAYARTRPYGLRSDSMELSSGCNMLNAFRKY